MTRYYPEGDFRIGERVRITDVDLIGYVTGIRRDEFGDQIIDLRVPNIPNDTTWVARSTEIVSEPANVYSRRPHRSA